MPPPASVRIIRFTVIFPCSYLCLFPPLSLVSLPSFWLLSPLGAPFCSSVSDLRPVCIRLTSRSHGTSELLIIPPISHHCTNHGRRGRQQVLWHTGGITWHIGDIMYPMARPTTPSSHRSTSTAGSVPITPYRTLIQITISNPTGLRVRRGSGSFLPLP
jgi:hypothetical protein